MTRARGFTLLEVLVAVALLGLVVTVLAQSAVQGMSYEGDASRRLRASLLADRELARIEAGLKLGTPPQPGHQESQEAEEFRLSVDVLAIDPAQSGFSALLGPPDGAPGAAPRAQQPSDGPSPAALPLFEILIRVAWTEGLQEQAVTRTTFAYDATAALQALAAANAQNNPQGQSEQNAPPPAEETPPEEESQ